MLSINTNIPSLIAQRSLNNSTKLLNQAIERMTTGFKINHASDNAANFSITTNMNTKLSSYQVAEDNVAMGLDLLSTAGGSLDLISDKLTRLRALAEQSANGTYGEKSLKAINSEANAIVDEIERIYSTAEYNGIKLFGESDAFFQGIGEGEFIEEIQQRDASNMTRLSSINSTETISSGTYSISTAEELAKLAEMTNNGKVTGGEFVLANNIDLSSYSTGEGWTPIGNETNQFSAFFDGNGYMIENLYINRPDDDYQGLFGYANGAEIKNIALENIDVRGWYYVGGLVGNLMDVTITNSYASGIVSGEICIGGLVGHIEDLGYIENSYTTGTITAQSVCGGFIGGVNGSNSTFTNCYSTSNVTACDGAGGFAGQLIASLVINCFSTGSVSGDQGIGGFVADIIGSAFEYCYSTGRVSGSDYTGGFVGTADQHSSIDGYYIQDRAGCSDTYAMEISEEEFEALIADGTLQKFSSKLAKPVPVPNISDSNQQIISFQVGINSDSFSQITLDTAFRLNFSSLRRIGKGKNYLSQIDNMINTLSAKQTDFGAAQNRLESALEEISTQYDNLVSSRSTLRDADIAGVSSEYIRQQILQQASATLMATANQSPSLALQLI